MSSPCTCVYIEVPFELLSSGGEQLYIVYTDCNGNLQNDNTGTLPSTVLGSSLLFYVRDFIIYLRSLFFSSMSFCRSLFFYSS